MSILCATGLACLLLGQTGCRHASLEPQDLVLETARKAFLSGQYSTAEDTYQYYLQMYPRGRFRLEAWQRLADIRQDSRDSPREAALLLETALLEFASEPSVTVDLLFRAAQLRMQSKDYGVATAHYEALRSLASLDSQLRLDAYLQLARLRLLTNDAPGALAILQECRQSRLQLSEQSFCSFRLAEILLSYDRAQEAEPILHDVFDAADTTPALRAQAGFSLGQIYESRKEVDKAREIYKNVLPLHPNSLVIQNRLDFLK
mgnify:CR=1 FL=1